MNRYRKSANEIMKRGDRIIAEKQRKKAAAVRSARTFAGACAIFAVCFGVWSSSNVHNADDIYFPEPSCSIAENTDIHTTAIRTTLPVTSTSAECTKSAAATQTVSQSARTTPTTAVMSKTPAAEIAVPVTESVNDKEDAEPVQPPETAPPTVTAATTAEPAPTTTIATHSLTESPLATQSPMSPDSANIGGNANPNGGNAGVPKPRCYCSIDLMGSTYESDEKLKLPQENIGEMIGAAEVKLGYYGGYKEHNELLTADAEVFTISDFSANYAVAAKYDGEYYIYKKSGYFPKTLGQLLSDCGLEKCLTISSAEYDNGTGYDIYQGFDANTVWELLSDERETAARQSSYFSAEARKSKLTFICEMPEVYNMHVSVMVSERGIVTVDIDKSSFSFRIGKKNTEKFINHIIQNYPKEESL